MNPSSDDIIISGIRKRDDNAFKYLQVKYQDSIRLMVREAGGSDEDARDIFSEGIVALIRLVDRKSFQLNCKLGTLIYALCDKAWKQQLERRIPAGKYRYKREDEHTESDFSEEQDEEVYRDIFWGSFQKLDPICQEILAAYLQEISPIVIAEQTGRSYGYIRKKKSLCHGYLIKMIESHPDYRKIKHEQGSFTTG